MIEHGLGCAPVHGAGDRGAGDDGEAAPSGDGDPLLRPGLPVHVARLRRPLSGMGRDAVDGFGRRLLRQRDGRKLLRDAGVRVDRPHEVGDARRGAVGRVRVHRRVYNTRRRWASSTANSFTGSLASAANIRSVMTVPAPDRAGGHAAPGGDVVGAVAGRFDNVCGDAGEPQGGDLILHQGDESSVSGAAGCGRPRSVVPWRDARRRSGGRRWRNVSAPGHGRAGRGCTAPSGAASRSVRRENVDVLLPIEDVPAQTPLYF